MKTKTDCESVTEVSSLLVVFDKDYDSSYARCERIDFCEFIANYRGIE